MDPSTIFSGSGKGIKIGDRWYLTPFEEGYTYLFEIIYPENKIVVNYDYSGLVLLAVRNT